MSRVLVADDDQAIRRLTSRLLGDVGVEEIVEAEDGREALERLSHSRFDLVVLDWRMPSVDGLELVRKVRADGSKVPIVLVTAEARKERVVEALRAGATDYLVKPFDNDVLRKKLAKYCREKTDWESPAVHRARDVMQTDVVTIHPEATVGQTIETLLRHGVGGLPVVDSHARLVGIITEFQLIRAIYQPEIKEQDVAELMTRDVVAVKEETTLAATARMMEKHRLRRVPVTRNHEVVGVVARRDLLRYITKNADAQSEFLNRGAVPVAAG